MIEQGRDTGLASSPRSFRYWLRLLGLFLVALVITLISLPFLLGLLSAAGLVYPPCRDSGANPGQFGYSWEDVTVQASAGGSFRGYLIPGSNGATVIVAPPLNTGRDGRLAEAILLRKHGFTVFTYESRRCAGMGGLSLGLKEVSEVGDALNYLQSRADVDPERIGIYGFSSAGATAIMAAACLPDIKAVVAEGGYGDFSRGVLGTGSSAGWRGLFEALYLESIRRSYRLLTGQSLEVLAPVRVIGKVRPRPILLIYGSREVSLVGGRQLKAAAGANAELWIVPGAGHGDYLVAAPEAYEARLVTFFEQALFSPAVVLPALPAGDGSLCPGSEEDPG